MPYADINGIRLHYVDRGSGTPLLLIHGLGTGSADWQEQLDVLAARYRVIAPCLRGFGESERFHGEYSIALFAADVAALLDHLQLDKAHVCGLSMGGAVAFQFAVDYPQRLLSLLVINSQPSFVLDTLKKKLMFHGRAWMARWLGLGFVGRFLARQNFPGAANRQRRQQLAGRFSNDLDIYLAALAALDGWRVTDRLAAIEVPVLVIAAELDYSTPGEKQRLVASLPDVSFVTVAGAHHAVHLERPAEVNEAILAFVDRIDQLRR